MDVNDVVVVAVDAVDDVVEIAGQGESDQHSTSCFFDHPVSIQQNGILVLLRRIEYSIRYRRK